MILFPFLLISVISFLNPLLFCGKKPKGSGLYQFRLSRWCSFFFVFGNREIGVCQHVVGYVHRNINLSGEV